jgi:hypothetical protein
MLVSTLLVWQIIRLCGIRITFFNLFEQKRVSSGKNVQLPQLHLFAHMSQHLWVLFGTCWRSDSLKNAFNIASLRQFVEVTTAVMSGSTVRRLKELYRTMATESLPSRPALPIYCTRSRTLCGAPYKTIL